MLRNIRFKSEWAMYIYDTLSEGKNYNKLTPFHKGTDNNLFSPISCSKGKKECLLVISSIHYCSKQVFFFHHFRARKIRQGACLCLRTRHLVGPSASKQVFPFHQFRFPKREQRVLTRLLIGPLADKSVLLFFHLPRCAGGCGGSAS